MSTKQNIRESVRDLNWVRLLIEVISIALVVSGIVATIAVTAGDGRWASKERTEDTFAAIKERMVRNEVLDEGHFGNRDFHLSQAETRIQYVTRPEWIDRNVSTAEALNKIEKQNAAFWSEQRAVNREILQRLPKQ